MEPIIELNKVAKRFGGITALSNASGFLLLRIIVAPALNKAFAMLKPKPLLDPVIRAVLF